MNKESIREFRVTADGSPTLYVAHFDEHYHSVHGARQESMHVFINAGLMYWVEKGHTQISILEVGLGTALNALLTIEAAQTLNLSIDYRALEAYPLSEEEINLLSFTDNPESQNWFRQIHHASWNQWNEISEQLSLFKQKVFLEDFEPDSEKYDLIYFDAFAPSAQPELWSEEVFAKMYHALKPGGILVTYCAKGVVKRAMKAVGFSVQALPGPPGKREMTRAVK